jgi:hypothetical protein
VVEYHHKKGSSLVLNVFREGLFCSGTAGNERRVRKFESGIAEAAVVSEE